MRTCFKLLCLLLLIQCNGVLFVFGQTAVENKYHPKNNVPPSPAVSNLLRLGEIPIEHSTGQASIAIPIFQINSGKLKHNISLQFSADGCKVDRSNGLLGQDWTLNVGGVLSRTLRDKADDNTSFNNKESGYFKGLITKTIAEPSFSGANIIDNSLYADFEHDIFSYYVNDGIGSKFILRHQGGQLLPQHLIFSMDSIQYKINQPALGIAQYKITSADGTIYVFGADGEYGFNENNSMGQNAGSSSYWLAKIISSDLTDSICFKYDPLISYRSSTRETLTFRDKHAYSPSEASTLPNNLGDNYGLPNNVSESYNIEYRSCSLSEVIFKNGKLQILKKTNSKSQIVLDKIVLLDNNGTVRKSFMAHINNFVKSGNNLSDYLKLDSISVSASDGNIKETHSFEYYYNSSIGFPEGTVSYKAKDWAGYYNGNTGPLIPSFQQISGWTGGDRKPNPTYALQGMLKSIIYPTKGRVNFDYEGNTFENTYYGQSITSGTYGPGLRIKRIYNLSQSTDTLNVRNFEYSDGNLNLAPTPDNMSSQYYYSIEGTNNQGIPGQHAYRERKFYDSFLSSVSALTSPSITYGNVREYKGNKNDNIGYYDYYFSSGQVNSVSPVSNVPYTVPYYLFGGFVNFTTFQNIDDIMRINSQFTPYVKPTLTQALEYEKVGLEYKLASSTKRKYQKITEPQIFEPVIEKFHFVQTTQGTYDMLLKQIQSSNNAVYFIDSTAINRGNLRLESEEKMEIMGTDTIKTQISYGYNGIKYLSPSNISSINSEGDFNIQKIKYPIDYKNLVSTDSLTTGIINLQKKNIISVPIEQSNFIQAKGSTAVLFTGSSINTFDKSIPHFKAGYESINTEPQSISGSTNIVAGKVNIDPVMKKSNEVLRYDSYQNPIEFRENKGPLTTYLWGYQGQFMVAKIENASYTQVLNIWGTNAATILSKLNNLNVSEAYIRTIVQDIRKHMSMQNAQVTTYTYDLFDGLTSKTDIRGFTEYYQYDGFQRLVAIKDFEGNLLKTFCYNYAGQQVDCSVLPTVFSSNSQSYSFTKNNCPSGQFGSAVIYHVPAGAYTSKISQIDADQKALNDVNENGQSYANQNGDCIVSDCLSYRVLIPNSVLAAHGGSIAIGHTPCGSTTITKLPYNSFEMETDANYPDYTIVRVCVAKNNPSLSFYRNYWDTNAIYIPEIQIESQGNCR